MLHWFRTILIAIGRALFAPLRALFELGDWIGHSTSRQREEGDGDDEPKPLWLRILLAPLRFVLRIGGLLLQVVAYPFQGWFHDPRSRRQFLKGLPAILVAGLVVFLLSQHVAVQGSLAARYATAFEAAKKEGDRARVDALTHRILRQGARTSPEVAFQYCMFLGENKEMERANTIIDTLAPDDVPGYAPAHEQRAIAYANLMAASRNTSSAVLNPLIWHINHSRSRNGERISLARAAYYQATQQYNACAKSLEDAARHNPEHWFSLANLASAVGDGKTAEQALKLARDEFQRRFAVDSLSKLDRMRAVEAMVRLRQFDEAIGAITGGLNLFPEDPDLLRARNGIEMARYDDAIQSGDKPAEKLAKLQELQASGRDQGWVYDRMLKLYEVADTDVRSSIRQSLSESAKATPDDPVLLFTLSSIALTDQRIQEGMELLEKTLTLDETNHLAMNNLAWLLAEHQPEQIDRAIQLVEQAITAVPTSPNYHDTFGMILFQKGDMERAITEMEKALPGMPPGSLPVIHKRLAKAYEALGNTSLAELYRKASTQTGPSPK